MPDYDAHLRALEAEHLRRRVRTIERAGPIATIEGRTTIVMASNDYLGLTTHPAVIEAAVDATRRCGAGAGAARLLSGTLPPHRDLETALARFKQTDRALIFGSGYLANIGLIPALAGRGALIVADRLAHASLWDGCRLSGADVRVFEHNDVSDLERVLRTRAAGRRAVVVTEGVFSMDGDVAPLPDLAAVAARYEADLVVDDAHGTAVMGPMGRGTIEHFGVQKQIPFQMGTLSKAIGTSGGFVVGETAFIEYLVNTARSFIYATAPPPGTTAAAVAALAVIDAEPERRSRLWANRDRLHDGLLKAGFRLSATASPILPILIGDAERALAFAQRLEALGVYAPAIRPPTVPADGSRVRLTVTAAHTVAQIEQVLAACGTAGRELRLI